MKKKSRGRAALHARLAALALGLLLVGGATQAHAITVAPASSAAFTSPATVPFVFGSNVAFVGLGQDVEYDLDYTFVAPAPDLTFNGATGSINWDVLDAGVAEAFTVPDSLSGRIALHHTYGAPGLYSIQADLTVSWIQAVSSVILSVVPGQTQDVQANLLAFALPTTTTPIPSSVLMLGTALAGLGFLGWRRRSTLAPVAF